MITGVTAKIYILQLNNTDVPAFSTLLECVKWDINNNNSTIVPDPCPNNLEIQLGTRVQQVDAYNDSAKPIITKCYPLPGKNTWIDTSGATATQYGSTFNPNLWIQVIKNPLGASSTNQIQMMIQFAVNVKCGSPKSLM